MNWLASPPAALVLFLGLAALLYLLGGKLAPRGKDSPGKHISYTGGEELEAGAGPLSYQRFFRLALLFVVAHMATLVIAMLPRAEDVRRLATLYLLVVAICLDVLIIRRFRA
jgi:NADH:ubiquinone oxidoreductase subunit 3 (subunit A)